MKNEHALRFLLLRQINIVRDQVTTDEFKRVAESLKIDMVGADYKVVWLSSQGIKEELVSKDGYQFYERGDINPENRRIEDSVVNRNEQQARQLTDKIFGRALDYNRRVKPTIDPFVVVDMVGDAILLVILFMVGELSVSTIMFLWPLFYVEYLPYGRLLTSFLLIGLAFTPLAPGLVVAGPVFMVLQFLDPSPHWRLWRVLISLVASACAIAVVFFYHQGPFYLGLSFWCGLILAGALNVFRILFACNHRGMRLALPFLAVGLFAAGFGHSAMIIFAYAVLALIVHAYGFKFLPFLSRLKSHA